MNQHLDLKPYTDRTKVQYMGGGGVKIGKLYTIQYPTLYTQHTMLY